MVGFYAPQRAIRETLRARHSLVSFVFFLTNVFLMCICLVFVFLLYLYLYLCSSLCSSANHSLISFSTFVQPCFFLFFYILSPIFFYYASQLAIPETLVSFGLSSKNAAFCKLCVSALKYAHFE